jgi:fermentation-respiration switch protein FrsA (DUF1100 family)
MRKSVSSCSEGVKLDADLFVPSDLGAGQKRAGVVLRHSHTGVKELYLPENATVLNEAGYVALTFDYKGWGSGRHGSRCAMDAERPPPTGRMG